MSGWKALTLRLTVRKNILASQLQISKGSKWRSNKEFFAATDDGWNTNEGPRSSKGQSKSRRNMSGSKRKGFDFHRRGAKNGR